MNSKLSNTAPIGCPRCLVTVPNESTTQSNALNNILKPFTSNGYELINTVTASGESIVQAFLPIYSMQIYLEIYGDVAYIRYKCIFINTTGSIVSGLFLFPNSTNQSVISSCEISYGDKVFSTVLVDSDETKFPFDVSLQNVIDDSSDYYLSMNSLLAKSFQMPFHSCDKNSEIVIELKYTQNMSINSSTGDYDIMVPSFIPPSQSIYNNYKYNQVINILCKLFPGHVTNTRFDYKSSTHQLKTKDTTETFIVFQGQADSNTDFHFGYNVWSDDVFASCLIQRGMKENEGSFMAAVWPPKPSRTREISRNIIFLFDRSASMGEKTMDTMKAGLSDVLDYLEPHDMFAICSYDDSIDWLPVLSTNQAMLQGTPSNIDNAKEWIRRNICAGRNTDYMQPFDKALEVLTSPHYSSPTRIPIIILITDGSTAQEHSICKLLEEKNSVSSANDTRIEIYHENDENDEEAEATRPISSKATKQNPVRVWTFGIGPYCNQYFLKRMAHIGRGYSEICYSQDTLYSQFTKFVRRLTKPVLSSVTVMLNQVNCQFEYPDVTHSPDLFVGQPLIFFGTYETGLPTHLLVRGINYDGRERSFNVKVKEISKYSPLLQIYHRQRLDSIIGRWWYEQEKEPVVPMSGKAPPKSKKKKRRKELKQDGIQASLMSLTPCIFTTMVEYQNKSIKIESLVMIQGLENDSCLPQSPPTMLEDVPVEYDKLFTIFSPYQTVLGTPRTPTSRKSSRSEMILPIDGAVVLYTASLPVSFHFGSIRATVVNMHTEIGFQAIESRGFDVDTFEIMGATFAKFEGLLERGLISFIEDDTKQRKGHGRRGSGGSGAVVIRQPGEDDVSRIRRDSDAGIDEEEGRTISDISSPRASRKHSKHDKRDRHRHRNHHGKSTCCGIQCCDAYEKSSLKSFCDATCVYVANIIFKCVSIRCRPCCNAAERTWNVVNYCFRILFCGHDDPDS